MSSNKRGPIAADATSREPADAALPSGCSAAQRCAAQRARSAAAAPPPPLPAAVGCFGFAAPASDAGAASTLLPAAGSWPRHARHA
eukprot:363965-Chlamydomonas_euryale.AAC.27